MSEKKLLEEQVVRRFMKLANINESVSEGFVKENMMPAPEEQGQMDEVDDLVDMEGGEEEGGGDKEELFKKVAQAVADAMGVDASIEGGEGGDDLEMGDEEEPDADNMGGPSDDDEDNAEDDEEEMDDEEDSEEDEEELEESEDKEEEVEEVEEGMEAEEQAELEEQIAETVLNRVKARLLKEAQEAKDNMSNIKKKKLAKGKKMEEASKGKKPSTGKAASMNWGLKGNKGVANVAKSKAKKGNLTPAKKSSKHMR